MRLGIVTDIHEQVEPLARVLGFFRDQAVDQVVNLGDACDLYSTFGRANEVAELLREANAVGVWGNHDFGLCYDVPKEIKKKASPELLEYMGTMKGRLVIEDCHFSHVEPYLDPYNVESLWSWGDLPVTPDAVRPSFEAVPQRLLLLGHFHKWLVMTPQGQVQWSGEEPLHLEPDQRYFIIVAPLMTGWCAILDTEENELLPHRVPVEKPLDDR